MNRGLYRFICILALISAIALGDVLSRHLGTKAVFADNQDSGFQERIKADTEDLEKNISGLKTLKKELEEKKKRSPREININWDAVEGALKYAVQVKDSGSTLIFDKVVETNSTKISVTPGEYRIRVGAFNVFEKIGSWSEWSDMKLVLPEASEAFELLSVTDHGFTFSAGYAAVQILPDFGSLFSPSTAGWTATAAYRMRSIAAFSSIPVLRNMLFGADISGSRFSGREIANIEDNRLYILTVSLSLSYVTDFGFPVNLAVRVGGGMARTTQSYSFPEIGGGVYHPKKLTTVDPYYRAGLGLVVSLFGPLFLEGGAEFFLIDYLATDLRGIRYYLMAGTRI